MVTTLAAPIGSWAAQHTAQMYIWAVYSAAVVYLAYRMFTPPQKAVEHPRFGWALVLAVPISALSGFLGVGPGFLLLPTLIITGFRRPTSSDIINRDLPSGTVPADKGTKAPR